MGILVFILNDLRKHASHVPRGFASIIAEQRQHTILEYVIIEERSIIDTPFTIFEPGSTVILFKSIMLLLLKI